MDEPLLRPATLADVPELVETVRQGFETYREWAPRGWDPPRARAAASPASATGWPSAAAWCEVAEAGPSSSARSGTVPARGAPRRRPHLDALRAPSRGGAPAWPRGCSRAPTRPRPTRDGRELRLHTPAEHARARAFYEREGWSAAATRCYEPMLGLVLISYRRPTGGAR